MSASHPEIGETIRKEKQLSDATIKALTDAIAEFKSTVPY
jgi:hypothetical protein